MLIQFNIKKNFYDDLQNDLLGIDTDEQYKINDLTYNFIPIKISNDYYILTSLKYLEGYLMDYKNFKAKLFIGNKTFIIDVKKVISFTEFDFMTNELYDCYIDSICNLLLIKFKCDELEYIQIDNSIDIKNDLCFGSEFKTLNYVWTECDLAKKNYLKNTTVEYIWNEKYLNLPPIPYIIDTNINKKLIPCTGAGVFETNKLVGMVSYVNNDDYEIIITPLICIKKLAKYLQGDNIYSLGINVHPIGLNFKSEINKIEYINGLIVGNNFYDNLVLKKNKINKKYQTQIPIRKNKITNQKNINYSIPDETLIKENKEQSFFEDLNEKIINYNDLHNKKDIESEKKYIESEKKDNDIDIKLKKMNICDEKSVETTLEPKNKELNKILEQSKFFKRKTVICVVDDFKINERGNLVIETKENLKKGDLYEISKTKEIPFKSYLWLFKNINDNNLKITYIPNNQHKFNMNLLENNFSEINDTDVPKRINLLTTNILINSCFNDISSVTIDNLCYIRTKQLKDIYFFELNEKILFGLKKIISVRPDAYTDTFVKIFSHRYTHNNLKILLMIDLKNKGYPDIKIINGYINFNEIITKYKTNKEKINFIKENSKILFVK